jgi:non-homologous end joining protein Ku
LPRALWKGAISFGLVSIPIKLHTAVRNQDKVKGKEVELEPTTEPRQAEVVDLMERLRRSLEQGGRQARGGSARQSSARARRAAAADKARSARPRKSASRKRSRRAA